MKWWWTCAALLGIAAAAFWYLVHPSVVTFVTALGFVGLVPIVRCTACRVKSSFLPEAASGAARWRISFAVIVFCLGLPVLLAILVAPSAGHGVLTALFGAGEGFVSVSRSDVLDGLFQELCFVAIPGLLIAIPARLHAKGRASRENSLVPRWLAGFAAVAAAGQVFVLHFLGDLLPKSGLGTLSVAAFTIAVLMAPFFKTVASTCWRGRVMVVLDPWLWWSEWLVAFKEMTANTAPPQLETEPLNTATGQPASDAK
jgi:hypothetical protein